MCLCVWTMSLIVRGSPCHLAEYIDAHTCYPHNLHSKEKKPKDCDKCEYIHKRLVTDKQEPIARCTHCEKWPWTQNEKETKRDEGFSGKRQLSNPDFSSEHKVNMFHLHFILSFTINPVIWSDQSSSLTIYVMFTSESTSTTPTSLLVLALLLQPDDGPAIKTQHLQ